jgi:hypothetical protein
MEVQQARWFRKLIGPLPQISTCSHLYKKNQTKNTQNLNRWNDEPDSLVRHILIHIAVQVKWEGSRKRPLDGVMWTPSGAQ